MAKTSRRTFLRTGVVGSVLSLFVRPSYAGSPTPDEIEGPFYPVFAQKDKDFDLTSIRGHAGIAQGKIILIQGQVLDTDNQPIEDATVELWQANAAGRYRHPHDRNTAPLDPDFQGWAIVPSGKDGAFRFKTIYPGAYPASATCMRPPHIHFKISKKGYVELITQMYFPDHELNNADLLLNRKNKAERHLMIASEVKDKPNIYKYDIVLE